LFRKFFYVEPFPKSCDQLSGKSYLAEDLIKNWGKVFPESKRIYRFAAAFKGFSDCYKRMAEALKPVKTTFSTGLPEQAADPDFWTPNDDPDLKLYDNVLLVDDISSELSKSPVLDALTTYLSHHRSITILILSQEWPRSASKNSVKTALKQSR